MQRFPESRATPEGLLSCAAVAGPPSPPEPATPVPAKVVMVPVARSTLRRAPGGPPRGTALLRLVSVGERHTCHFVPATTQTKQNGFLFRHLLRLLDCSNLLLASCPFV